VLFEKVGFALLGVFWSSITAKFEGDHSLWGVTNAGEVGKNSPLSTKNVL